MPPLLAPLRSPPIGFTISAHRCPPPTALNSLISMPGSGCPVAQGLMPRRLFRHDRHLCPSLLRLGTPRTSLRAARQEGGLETVITLTIAVGTPITGRPPHRTVRAAFLHTAPTSDD
jgi:hypothetical protein